MTDVGTEYWLGSVPLAYTRIKWPMAYRGTQHVPCVFYQPTEMFDLIDALPRNEAGVTLKVICQGENGPYEQQIKGVQIVSVEKLVERDEADGCRVIIADRRWRLEEEIMQQSWSLLYQGQYLEGTAKSLRKAYRLDVALQEHLIGQYPFAGYMANGWDTAIKPRGDFNYLVPNDLLYAGKPMAPTLQKLLEWWGVDLSVDIDGNFYLATRLSGPTGDDDGLEIVKQYFKEWEWIDTEPEVNKKRSDGRLPKKIKIPFWERHTLQVPYGNIVDTKKPSTGGGGGGGDVPKPPHDLELVPAYKVGGRFLNYENLQTAYGVSLTDKPREFFLSPTMIGTKLYHGAVDSTDIEQGKKFTLTQIIAESERVYYGIVHTKNNTQKSAWTDFALGVVSGDGVIQPRDAIGNWTELYEKINPKPGIVTGNVLIENVPIARVHTFLDQYDAQGKLKDTFEPFVDKPISLADLGLDRPAWEQKRSLAEAAPFNVTWAAKEVGIIKLSLDKRRAKPGSDAIIGTPESVGFIGTRVNLREKLQKSYKQKYKALNLKMQQHRDDMIFPVDYSMWIYVAATRNFPNNKDKFWVETVDGVQDGDVEEMWLEADMRTFAYRDFVNKTPAVGLQNHTEEKKRPNGNDGYGKVLNRGELKRTAQMRGDLALMALLEPAAWTHEFLNFTVVAKFKKMKGAMDSIVLDINGKVVKAELAMGTRSNDQARRQEAMSRAIRQVQEIAGKKLER